MTIVYHYKTKKTSQPLSVYRIIEYYDKIISDLHNFKDLVSSYETLKEKDIIGIDETQLTEYLSSGIRDRHDEISDLVLYIVLLRIDIEICCKNLLINKETGNIFEMNYFTRALATHCSDTVKPQNDKLLNRLNTIIRQYRNLPEYEAALKELITNKDRLRKIGDENIDNYDGLRNALFAHRDGKGIDQHKTLNEIKVENTALTGDQINSLLSDIIGDLLAIQSILTPLKK